MLFCSWTFRPVLRPRLRGLLAHALAAPAPGTSLCPRRRAWSSPAMRSASGGCWRPVSTFTPRGTASSPCSSAPRRCWITSSAWAWKRSSAASLRRSPARPEPGGQPRPAAAISNTPTSSSTPCKKSCTPPACPPRCRVLKVILPVGISFYTFEAINYTVDVFRRRVPAERNPAHLLFFILFFPHLIAGPIVRARDFLPQIRRPKRWSWARFQLGVEYFLLGLFKKWLVADQLAVYADPVFADPAGVRHAGQLAGPARLHLAGLLRHLRLLRHGPGTAHLLGYKLADELQHALPGHQRRRLLAALSHLAVHLAARLPVHSAGRQPRQQLADLPQPADHHDAGRPVARGELELRPLGRPARRLAVDQPFLPLLLRGQAAPRRRACRACPARPCAWP